MHDACNAIPPFRHGKALGPACRARASRCAGLRATSFTTAFGTASCMAAGTFLEEQVSAAVGVSRTPVSEAFQQERVAMASVSINPCRRRIMLDGHEQLAALAMHDEAAAVATLARHLRPIQDILACLPGRQ